MVVLDKLCALYTERAVLGVAPEVADPLLVLVVRKILSFSRFTQEGSEEFLDVLKKLSGEARCSTAVLALVCNIEVNNCLNLNTEGCNEAHSGKPVSGYSGCRRGDPLSEQN